MTSRRDVLKTLGFSAVATGLPSVAFARTDTDARLVLVILRGAVDGLALAAPYGDGNYRKHRGELALPSPGSASGALKLDGMFALHPALTGIHGDFRNGEALLLHAVASPYRDRSHFDGQDVLENGAANVGALRDGWLNRAIAPLGGSLGSEHAVAMGQNTPLVLRGSNSVTSWAPSGLPDAQDSTLQRLQDLYADDEFFATRLTQALKSQEIAGNMGGSRNRGNEAVKFPRIDAVDSPIPYRCGRTTNCRCRVGWLGYTRQPGCSDGRPGQPVHDARRRRSPNFAIRSTQPGPIRLLLWSPSLAERYGSMGRAARITVLAQRPS